MLNGVNEKPNAGKVVGSSGTTVETEGEEIIITVKIPKPEALIFSHRMDVKYNSIPLQSSFAAKIMESVKKKPF